MTRFITELAIPEVEVSDAYAYGANFMNAYYEALLNNNIDPNFMFGMYFDGNIDDMNKFKNSLGENLESVLDTIEKVNNKEIYVKKIVLARKDNPNITPEEVIGKTLTDEEIKLIIAEAVNNINVRQ